MVDFARVIILSACMFGAAGSVFAGCAPSELERVGTNEAPTIRQIYDGGRLVAVVRGEQTFKVARDFSGKITGVIDTQTERVLSTADLAAPSKGKSQKDVAQPDFDPCTGMGGDSFILNMEIDRLPLVEVQGNRATEPPYWQPILAPAFPSDAELSGIPVDQSQTDKNKRCEGRKNQCLAAVEGDWKAGAGLAAVACTKAGELADRYLNKNKYGRLIGVAVVLACAIAHDNYVEMKKKLCNDDFAACLVGQ